MNWEHDGTVHEKCVVIYRVKEEWGELSNMSNDFPLTVAGISVGSSEAPYQAMRFPHQPEWQKEVLDAGHAMAAKLKSKKEKRRDTGSRPDWNAVNLDVMRWVMRVKLAQHFKTIGRLLRATRDKAVVELSKKDRFWGAVEGDDGVLRGENHLGRLLMELRAEVLAKPEAELLRVEPPTIPDFMLLGKPVGVVEGRKG